MEYSEHERIPALNPEGIAESPEQAERMRHDAFLLDIEEAAAVSDLLESVRSHYDRGGSVTTSAGEEYPQEELVAALEEGKVDQVTRQYGLRDALLRLQGGVETFGEAAADVPDAAWSEYFEQQASAVASREAFKEQLYTLEVNPEYEQLQPIFQRLRTEIARLEDVEANDATFTEHVFSNPFRSIMLQYMQLP